MDENTNSSEPSKFITWLDANYENLYNGGDADLEEIARKVWNQCAQEAVNIARENRIKEREGKLTDAHDYTIGQLIQLKIPFPIKLK